LLPVQDQPRQSQPELDAPDLALTAFPALGSAHESWTYHCRPVPAVPVLPQLNAPLLTCTLLSNALLPQRTAPVLCAARVATPWHSRAASAPLRWPQHRLPHLSCRSSTNLGKAHDTCPLHCCRTVPLRDIACRIKTRRCCQTSAEPSSAGLTPPVRAITTPYTGCCRFSLAMQLVQCINDRI
jgi:hypothetical protein